MDEAQAIRAEAVLAAARVYEGQGRDSYYVLDLAKRIEKYIKTGETR